MKTNKKIVSLMLAAVLLLSTMLTGCFLNLEKEAEASSLVLLPEPKVTVALSAINSAN